MRESALVPARIWDLPLRMFHWLLLACVAVCAVTGFLLPVTWIAWHLTAGTLIAVLLACRLVWGFTGSTFSRFASFAFSPARTVAYVGDQLRGGAPHFAGHNPAGAGMIFLLLLTLLAIVITGAVVLGGAEKQGPLHAVVSYAIGSQFREAHELAAIALLALIAGHVLGVIVESVRSGENLPRGMVTGLKRTKAETAVQPPRPAATAVGLVTAAALIAVPLAALWRLAPAGLPPAALDAVYAKECGDCHNAFHPSLLTAAAWRAIMTSLDDHFGEDAGLKQDVAASLAAYLEANAAEHWDTRAANVFRRMDAKEPLRITATPFWLRRHAAIDPAVFKFEKVGTKSNCEACHGDARQGLFTPQAINLPKE